MLFRYLCQVSDEIVALFRFFQATEGHFCFGRRLAEARNGAGEAKGALEEMGIELFNSDGTARDTMEVLNDVADAMKGMSVQTDRNRIAMRLFDSEGVALVNMLRDGSAALDKKRQSARELGIVLEEDLIRGAEDAEDQLGLMAQVVKAQLSSALIELAPLLVGGAKLVAELAAAFGLAIRGINDFLYPQSELEIATSNIVLAMADEIRQTQQLKAAMAQGATMSVDMAQKKLAEAVARRENARAAIEERRAIALASNEMQDINDAIEGQQAALNAIAAPGSEDARGSMAQAYEDRQRRIVELMKRRAELLQADEDMLQQLQDVEDNIAMLEQSLTDARDGMVRLGGDMVDPVELGERLEGGIRGARTETEDLADAFSELEQASPALQQLGLDAEKLKEVMGTVQSSMENAFMSMLDGTATAGDAFRAMAADIIRELYRVLVVQRLVGSFTAGGGGILGSIFGAMGGATGAASGRSVQAGQPYTVGEHGRELFVPSTSGRVLSAAQTQNAMRGDGGVVINQTFQFSANGDDSVKRIIAQEAPKIAALTQKQIVDQRRRGGAMKGAFG